MRRVAGFTILEIVVAVFMAATLLTIGLMAMPQATSQATASGLANEVAEELRKARHRAQGENHPVAVCFPNSNQTTPVSAGLYNLVGDENPKVDFSLRFDAEYGPTAIFSGTVGAADGSPPDAGAKMPDFDLPTWLGTTTDSVIVFLPTGEALSNLPSHNGRYGLVTSSRFTYSSSWPFVLNSAHRAKSVWVNPMGTVVVEDSLPVGVASSDVEQAVTAAIPPQVSAAGTNTPQISSIVSDPTFDDGIYDHLGPDVWGSIRRGEYVSFVVEATDLDGGPLFSRWQGLGSFSSASEGRMEWDESARVWRAVWSWTPPANVTAADVGTIYDLVCEVFDEEGNTYTASGALIPKIALSADSIIAASGSYPDGKYRVIMTEEGHVTSRLKRPGGSPSPISFQPDGRLMVAYENAGMGPNHVIFFYNAEGKILPGTIIGAEPRLSPDGTQIAFHRMYTDTVYWGSWDGSSLSSYNRPGFGMTRPAISGDHMLTTTTDGVCYFNTTDPAGTYFVLPDSTPGDSIGSFTPDGSQISYVSDGELYLIDNPPYTGPVGAKVAKPNTHLTSSLPRVRVAHSWSADRARLIYATDIGGGQAAIFMGELDSPASPTTIVSSRQVSNLDVSLDIGLHWVSP